MAIIQLKCRNCDGILDIDENREVMCCPYCGAKEMFEISDPVRIEKIRAQAYKDVTLGSLQMKQNAEREKAEREEKQRRNSILGLLGALIVGCVVLILLLTR